MVTIGGRAHTIDEIKEVCRLDYPYIEINLDHPEKIEAQLEELLDLKNQFGVYYLAHYPNEGNPADLENLRNHFVPKVKKLITLSETLGIPKGTIHFWMDKRWASEEIIASKISMLSELVQHAKDHGVILCLENLTARQDSFSYYFSEIPELRMTMDIGHGQLLSKKNTSFGFMKHLFEKIAHVHVHDNLGGTGVQDDLHLPLGEGIVDYPGIFSILAEKGYENTITMEVKPDQMVKTQSTIEQFFR